MEPTLLRIPKECLFVYEVGLRLQQAFVLHDEATASHTSEDWHSLVRALVALRSAISSLGSVKVEFAPTAELVTDRIHRAREEWDGWKMLGSKARSTQSPLLRELEKTHDEFNAILHCAAHRTLREDENPDSMLQNWFQLGLTIMSGSYDPELREWRWNSRERLNDLLLSLRIALSTVYAPGDLLSLRRRQYSIDHVGWDSVDTALSALHQDSTAGPRRSDPDRAVSKPHSEKDAHSGGTTPAVKEAERAPEPAPTNNDAGPPTHSPDFRCVNWYGTPYSFSVTQAACVEALWRAAAAGRPHVSQADVLQGLTKSEPPRLHNLFKGDPAWGTMIIPVEGRKGMFMLSKPVPPEPPCTPEQ
jgi:hypothetical protein